MSKQSMREEAERLIRETMERKALVVKQGNTRIETTCGKCGAPNRVSAEATKQSSFLSSLCFTKAGLLRCARNGGLKIVCSGCLKIECTRSQSRSSYPSPSWGGGPAEGRSGGGCFSK